MVRKQDTEGDELTNPWLGIGLVGRPPPSSSPSLPQWGILVTPSCLTDQVNDCSVVSSLGRTDHRKEGEEDEIECNWRWIIGQGDPRRTSSSQLPSEIQSWWLRKNDIETSTRIVRQRVVVGNSKNYWSLFLFISSHHILCSKSSSPCGVVITLSIH